jgi:DNA-binding transcriptional ArsR family regulator
LTFFPNWLKLNHMVDYLSGTLHALADPTRRAIFAMLIEKQSCTIKEVAAPFDMSLAGVSKHVQVLERARLVRRRKSGRQNHLAPDPRPLAAVSDWLVFRQSHWNARFADLDAVLRADSAPREKKKKTKAS